MLSGDRNSFAELTSYNFDVFMNPAIINGLAGLQSLSAVSASCDTDNCSFATYDGVTHSTLGVESTCFDLSPFITQRSNISTANATFESDGHFQASLKWTNYSLPTQDWAGMRFMVENLGYLVNGSDEFTPWSARPWYPAWSINTSDIIPPAFNEIYNIIIGNRKGGSISCTSLHQLIADLAYDYY